MNRLLPVFKKYWLAALSFLLFVSLLFWYLTLPKKGAPVTERVKNIELYKNAIRPGQSVNDLINLLGEPISTSEQDQYKVLEYPSAFNKYTSKIFTSEEKIKFIREPVKYEERRKIDSYLNQLGEPVAKLYDRGLGPSYLGYIYPEQGLAVFAHITDGIIIEIWYFQPTDLNGFLTTWGEDLVENPPDEPETIK